MNELLGKISSYHLFNYLFPGCLFAITAAKLTGRGFIQPNLLLGLFLYYFYGLVISRIGSLIVEPILKSSRFLVFAEYRQFVAACKVDPKIDVLSESNNMYRTICSLLIVCVALQGYAWVEIRYPALRLGDKPALIIMLLAMFMFSYRKQTDYIKKRVEANQEK
jgi:hypothetical protein